MKTSNGKQNLEFTGAFEFENLKWQRVYVAHADWQPQKSLLTCE
jgi:hypothetical protein